MAVNPIKITGHSTISNTGKIRKLESCQRLVKVVYTLMCSEGSAYGYLTISIVIVLSRVKNNPDKLNQSQPMIFPWVKVLNIQNPEL